MSSNVSSPSHTNPVGEPGKAANAAVEMAVASSASTRRWRENPERAAWAVMIGSFALFMALLIAVPLSVRYAIQHMSVAESAVLEPTQGTFLLYPSADAEPIAVTDRREDVEEGSRIVAADDSTQGAIGLIKDQVTGEQLGSMQAYPGTDLHILKLRRPRFDRSTEPYRVKLRLDSGQARIFTNSGERPLSVELETPHGMIDMGAGSYRVSVDEERTEVTARSGQATLTANNGESIDVTTGLRVWSSGDVLSEEPISAEQNLIRNGDFSQPILDTWQRYVDANGVTPGKVQLIERDGRRVAHFIRQGEENVHTEVGIIQDIDKDVNVYDDLTLQLDVRLLYQSLPGAGYLSSEFPLRVEISYTDQYGKELRWGRGFYFRDPEDPNWRVVDGEKIPPYNWYTYRSPNLLTLLGDTRPAHINSIRIYASGWNYQSMVSEVYLFAE
jgi:hypothetical protein